MWQRIAWAIVFGVCVGGPNRSDGQEDTPPGNLIARCKWARFEIVSGRVTLTDTRLGQKSTLASNNPEKGIRESLSFSAKSPESASLHYEYASASQRMFVDVERSKQVTISLLSRVDNDFAAVRYRQPARGDVTLVIDDDVETREIVAPSFWHLMLAEREMCCRHLVPVLESVRPNWRLEPRARQLEDALFDVARSGKLPDAGRLRQLVRQLRHPKFERRQAADRQLREMGQSVLAFLERLDEKALDVEQRTRVRNIKQALTVTDGDTPVRVASWLADNSHIWLTLLDRADAKKRSTAAKHLEMICGQSLPFDPLASDMDRRRQIDQLRSDLGLDRPILVSEKKDTSKFR